MMLNNRHGQAKILTSHEIQLLLKVGFTSARDKAIFMICYYTGCRISEARQILFKCVFYKENVLEEIVIPKEITKGKQRTRTIPTHPSLKIFLENYYQESLELLKLYRLTGGWSHLNMNEDGKVIVNQYLGCPQCGSTRLIKHGTYKGEQSYFCKECIHQFQEAVAVKNHAVMEKTVAYDPLGVIASNNYGLLFADPHNPYLFPGSKGKGCLSLRGAMGIFEEAFAKAGISGASSHSCRRTALTTMHLAKVPLRVLQEISGHSDLAVLQRYLDVNEEEICAAINLLN
jgi:integrase